MSRAVRESNSPEMIRCIFFSGFVVPADGCFMACHLLRCKDTNKRAKYKACFDILQRVQCIFAVYGKDNKNERKFI
jgi:hypothetical protein